LALAANRLRPNEGKALMKDLQSLFLQKSALIFHWNRIHHDASAEYFSVFYLVASKYFDQFLLVDAAVSNQVPTSSTRRHKASKYLMIRLMARKSCTTWVNGFET
jgi:hypothetical protein